MSAATYWVRRSHRSVWHLNGEGVRALCGTHLGYGPASYAAEGDTTRRCARCTAKAAK